MNIAIIGRTNILLKSAYLLNQNNFKIKVVIAAKESDHEKTNINDFESTQLKNSSNKIRNDINSIQI